MSRTLPKLLGLAALVVLAWVGAGVWFLFTAWQDADRGRELLTDARAAFEEVDGVDDVRDGGVSATLDDARDAFARARDRSSSPLVLPLRVLPVLGRQVRAFSALSGAAARVSSVGGEGLDEIDRLMEERPERGVDRVALLARMEAFTDDALARLDGVDLGPSEALVGPVDEARREFGEELDEIRTMLTTARDVSGSLRTVLQGPSDYLLLAANNAEMRLGSGMFLSAGVLTFDRGELRLGELVSVEDLYLDEAAAVPLAPEVETLWGWTDIRREWRDLGLSPRFEVTAEQGARMWAASGRGPVDGVIAVDMVALQAVLATTGGVEVDGVVYTADTVLPQLLIEQYEGFEEADDVIARRELLGRVASSVFGAVEGGRWEPADLGEALGEAAAGRHLMVWSVDEGTQEAWASAGVDGGLEGTSVLMGLVNRGGNKLDQFMTLGADVGIEAGSTAAGERRVTLDLLVRNETPGTAPAYVLGVGPDHEGPPPPYVGLLTVTIPRVAHDVTLGDRNVVVSGSDGPVGLVATDMEVPAGTEQRVTLSFALPAETEMVLEPAARVPPAWWTVGGTTRQADSRTTVP